MYDEFLKKRSSDSQGRLNDLRRKVSKITELSKEADLSIYVTGSYGRLEASAKSDLDLFFVHDNTQAQSQVNRLAKILIDAELIKIVRKLSFPDFSHDGHILEIHYLQDMLNTLGGPEDDFKNHFTARLLLLLESRPISNDEAYSRIIEQIVRSYFRDYHDHEEEFRPIFMVNDILRFWKTLCLNYEKKRNSPAEDTEGENKNRLHNLKLKFSRLLTCFSTVIPLSTGHYNSPEAITKLIRRPPLERLKNITEQDYDGKGEILEKITGEYVWFLKITAKEDIVQWVADEKNRVEAFQRADHFGKHIYQILNASADADLKRYLVI